MMNPSICGKRQMRAFGTRGELIASMFVANGKSVPKARTENADNPQPVPEAPDDNRPRF